MHFFCTLARFSLLAAGLFLRSRLRGTQGVRMYSRRKFGPRLGSAARALGIQSRASWQVITGSLSVEPEPSRTTETQPKKMNLRCKFRMFCAVCNSSHLAWPSGHLATRPSSRATAVTLRVRFFVPRCFRVYVRIRVCTYSRMTNGNISQPAV